MEFRNLDGGEDMKRETYLIKVLTPLHVGAGQGLSHIDLPITRETHTGFPFIPGSSVKGCIREHSIKQLAKEAGVEPSKIDEALHNGGELQNIADKIEELVKIFGTAGESAEGGFGGAGKVSFTDARILFFPVKSLKGIFQLITCPYVINRYLEDIKEDIKDSDRLNIDLPEGKALVYSNNFLVEGKILLEEFVFEAEENTELKRVIDSMPLDEYQKNRVVCINDSIFSDMVQTYTEVQTHIKINPDTGTVSEGALWTAEYLPAESVLYFNLSFEEDIDFSIPEVFCIGGDITTGKGFVKVIKAKEVNT